MAADELLHTALQGMRDAPDRLIDVILQQGQLIHELRGELRQAQARIDDLQARLEEAERAAKRPAAPFRMEAAKRKKAPKKPGRKPAYRPRPDRIDETIEVPLPASPDCGRAVEAVEVLEQFIEDVPPPRRHVTHLRTYRGRCPACGPVASEHPLKTSQATGAAAVQLGAHVLGFAAELIYDSGLTRRKAARLLRQRFGLSVSPGGLQQAAHRLARRLAPRYAALKRALRAAAVVHADETSWYVGTAGGEPRAWLWVFCHAEATIYQVERSRGRAIITDALGEDFQGVLVSDCLNIYDEATPVQHKCYAHHLKAISMALAEAGAAGGPGSWLRSVRGLLKAAMALKQAGADLPSSIYESYCAVLEQRADALLGQAGVSPWDQSVQARLLKQRDHLFTFLYHQSVDATNNRAERQLRPAVVTRKLMCGNRSDRGAETWSVLSSLAATARQRGTTLADWIVKELRGEPLPGLEPALGR